MDLLSRTKAALNRGTINGLPGECNGTPTSPASIRFGKSLRSDVTGDGAWREQNLAWLQSFRFDQEDYTLKRDVVTIFKGRTGIRILLADMIVF